MNIIKNVKKESGFSKQNYLADTRPRLKTYDLDKMARDRKAIKDTYNTKFDWVLYDFEMNELEVCENLDDYKLKEFNYFSKTYPASFIRYIFPELVKIEDNKIVWDKDVYYLTKWGDHDKYFRLMKVLENEIVGWYLQNNELWEQVKLDKDKFNECLILGLRKLNLEN